MEDVILYSKCIAAAFAGVAIAMALVVVAGVIMTLLNPLPDAPDLDDPDLADR